MADESPYSPYRPPASPQAEPEPGYARYDAPPPPPLPPAPPTPARSSATLVGAVAAVVALLGALVAGGVLLLRSTGPEEVETPSGTIEVDDSSVGRQLEETRSRYLDALKAGRLPQVGLEDTPYNRTAVAAFSFFLTDMISATRFGIDQDTAVRYAEDAARYERLLLAGKPLGDDIEITFSEDRVFRYDGSTGEGGYEE